MFPSMRDALSGFGQRRQFAIVAKTAVDFEVSEALANVIWFTGVFQPFPPRRLEKKPEGQRSWKWYTVWTTALLSMDDIVQDKANKQFRVMSDSDWSEAGYYSYELAEQSKA